MYLLDTNIISETIKKQPAPSVLSWLSTKDINIFFLSALTIGEIRKGIIKLSDVSKQQMITEWLETELQKRFYGRIINIDSHVAEKWGLVSAKTTIPAVDGLIAASCLVHNLKLVTRNVKDFESVPGLEIINPWL